MEQSAIDTYTLYPKFRRIIEQGYKPIKEYDWFILFEKEVGGKALYKECFHKLDLFGEEWARSPRTKKKGKYD